MRFRAELLLNGKTATGIEVPAEVVEALGSKRAAVRVTLNGYAYRSTIGSMGGRSLIPVSAEHRKGAGLTAGDEVDVELELDTAPRETPVPAELAAALEKDAAAKKFFDSLPPSHQRAYTTWIDDAKKAETRERRVEQAAEMLRAGKRRS